MRRPNRNIELFSLSVLDLFSAAMGAFIMIAIVLFPYYMKNADLVKEAQRLGSQVADLQKGNADLQKGNADLQKVFGTCQADAAAASKRADDNAKGASAANERLEKCMRIAGKNFMVAVIDWRVEGFDVDLHVLDTEKREFFYEKKSYPGSPAELSLDNRFGPGIEVWQHPDAAPGDYCVAYVLYEVFNRHKGNPNVSLQINGKIFYRAGNVPLPAVTLTLNQRFAEAAAIKLRDDGSLVVSPGGSCSRQWNKKFEPEIKRARPT